MFYVIEVTGRVMRICSVFLTLQRGKETKGLGRKPTQTLEEKEKKSTKKGGPRDRTSCIRVPIKCGKWVCPLDCKNAPSCNL